MTLMAVTVRELAALPDREALVAHLRATLPHLSPSDAATSPIRGGRSAALQALGAIRPQAYERTRNFLAGDVTRLSAPLRHGVLTLSEVRDRALAVAERPGDAGKLVNEFAWRDYWQRLYFQLGEGIWDDREALKTGFRAEDYTSDLPQDLADGETTLRCMDSFADDLASHGWLHNHARMWLAAYLVHWRRVRWQTGARWFLRHLIDGDPASNNLSWQWVASSFSSKPYIFNRENLERYTDGLYCRACKHAAAGTCPFEATYEELSDELFPRLHDRGDGTTTLPYLPPLRERPAPAPLSPSVGDRPLLWVHTDGLNPEWPAFREHPNSPSVFVWDTAWLAAEQITLKRVVFIAECLREMPPALAIHAGDPASEILAAARAHGSTHVLALRTPDPRLQAAALTVRQHLPVVWLDPPAFAAGVREGDLKRFSRYWQRAQSSALHPTRA